MKVNFDGHKLELLEDININGHVIPCGFVSDGASVPRAFWWIARPFGEILPSALVHDFLLTKYKGRQRKKADAIFLSTLKWQGIAKVRRTILYRAVRAYSIFKGSLKID